VSVGIDIRLVRLLQLASPTLPVGAYSYSQGLESAVDAGIVRDARSAAHWITDVAEFSVVRTEVPILRRLMEAWRSADLNTVRKWNALFLATRETAELRAETVQMGYSLARLLCDLRAAEFSNVDELKRIEEISFPAAFAYAVTQWRIEPEQALLAYLWAWLENQAMSAVKVVPLGQTEGQNLLLEIGGTLPDAASRAMAIADDDIGGFVPRMAILSSRHETQYSRLFRS
jgi:urease accessory protein